jgi:hypothetical protein
MRGINLMEETNKASVYIIAAKLVKESFVGNFMADEINFDFTYVPKTARVVNKKLNLLGTVNINAPNLSGYKLNNVKVILASAQAEITSFSLNTMIREDQRTKDNTDAGNGESSKGHIPDKTLANTRATSLKSSCGVLYFKLQPLNDLLPNTPVDLNHTQVNVRIVPTDEKERKLHVVYSSIIDALYEHKSKTLPKLLKELNRLLINRDSLAPQQ